MYICMSNALMTIRYGYVREGQNIDIGISIEREHLCTCVESLIDERNGRERERR